MMQSRLLAPSKIDEGGIYKIGRIDIYQANIKTMDKVIRRKSGLMKERHL